MVPYLISTQGSRELLGCFVSSLGMGRAPWSIDKSKIISINSCHLNNNFNQNSLLWMQLWKLINLGTGRFTKFNICCCLTFGGFLCGEGIMNEMMKCFCWWMLCIVFFLGASCRITTRLGWYAVLMGYPFLNWEKHVTISVSPLSIVL